MKGKMMYPPGNVAKRGERKESPKMKGKGYAKGGVVKVKGKNC